MVFLAGPRQSGKTTLGDIISATFINHRYFNWDIAGHRTEFINNPAFFTELSRRDNSLPLVVFDEIHKYSDWKNYLKGVFDQYGNNYQFLISGSGRLDLYQKGSDSLAGRYFLFHLWPFTIAELGGKSTTLDDFFHKPLQASMADRKTFETIWDNLSRFSGFPEPYLRGKPTFYRRWSSTYSRQLIREDIRDLTGIKSIMDVETLYMLLPSKVGSPISIPALSRDLKVSYNSVQSWLSVLEAFFMIFSISPWTKKITRAIQKERKFYLWDTPRIKDPGTRFENMVALELFRAVVSWNDMGFGSFSLHFIKNKEQQEVDFLIADSNKPLLLVEAKLKDKEPSPALIKFQNYLNIPAVQLVETGSTFRMKANGSNEVLIIPAAQWLARLP
ncbi:MAG: ATP-binding protein [Thermodesulfobacteriota bacterium]